MQWMYSDWACLLATLSFAPSRVAIAGSPSPSSRDPCRRHLPLATTGPPPPLRSSSSSPPAVPRAEGAAGRLAVAASAHLTDIPWRERVTAVSRQHVYEPVRWPLLACWAQPAASRHNLHLQALLLSHGFQTWSSDCVVLKVGDKASRSSTSFSQRVPAPYLPPWLEKRDDLPICRVVGMLYLDGAHISQIVMRAGDKTFLSQHPLPNQDLWIVNHDQSSHQQQVREGSGNGEGDDINLSKKHYPRSKLQSEQCMHLTPVKITGID